MTPLRDATYAAELLGEPVSRVYALARAGVLPHVRLGRRIKVDPEVLRAWIERGGAALPGGWRREAPSSDGNSAAA